MLVRQDGSRLPGLELQGGEQAALPTVHRAVLVGLLIDVEGGSASSARTLSVRQRT
ncbi:MAG: hypothetical protein M3N32_10935 [Actinomycetota bacterium]|nr:hypothetical protein [Actinomycetota bacterium]